MTKSLSVEAILEILKSADFDEINGTIEDAQIEFKASPYQLLSDSAKCELAKDVSSLANAIGGIILIGFRTVKDKDTSVEYVDECRPFEPSLFDLDQHMKILNDWISPKLNCIRIEYFPSLSNGRKGVAAILVPAVALEGKPYIVNRSVESDGRVRGTLFGYYERVEDRIPAISAEALRTYLRDGMRFAEVMRRLDTIEAFLGKTVPSLLPPTTDLDILEPTTKLDILARVSSAVEAAGRGSYANIILAAASTSPCTFPDLFSSASAPLVKLIESPPLLRREGFAITPRFRDRRSEIIEGKSRRVIARGDRLTELWEDGLLVAVGPGDDDMLCWFMRNQKSPKPGLPIRNFVLTEVTLNFCILAVEVFKFATPLPRELRFMLKLDNMSEDGVPCRLSTNDDSGPDRIGLPFAVKNAPGPTIACEVVVPFKDIDIGAVAYDLLGKLYVEFGFNKDEMPYKEDDQKRITAKSVFPNLAK